MNEFVASNGVKVSSETQGITGYRRIKFETDHTGETVELSGANTVALIESLDHERDEDLGRWRWPENPEYVVYPTHGGYQVVNERNGVAEFRNGLYAHDMEGQAAKAYRDDCNDRPWDAAVDGEIWEVDNLGPDRQYIVMGGRFFRLPLLPPSDPSWHPALFASDFRTAKRIWPESE